MTFREKYCEDHCVELESMIGYGCPYRYGYEADPACADAVMHCDDCWNREMPCTGPAECAKLPTDESISVVSSQTPAINSAAAEKLEAEITRLNERIRNDQKLIDKCYELIDLYRALFRTI